MENHLDEAETRRMLEVQADGDIEFFRELVAIQEEEGERHLAILKESLLSGDQEKFYRVAHTFKGTAATFGMPRLKALAGSMQEASRDGMPEDAEEWVERLEDEYSRGLEALKDFQDAMLVK